MGERDLVAAIGEGITPLYAFVSRRTGGDRTLAEDVTQEACLRAVRHWRNGGFPKDAQAWLRTVARNLLTDHYRKRAPAVVAPERLSLVLAREEPPGPDVATLLGWAFARMRSGQVSILEAYHFEGKDMATIAEEMGVSQRAVEGRLRRARKSLGRKLRQRPKEADDDG